MQLETERERLIYNLGYEKGYNEGYKVARNKYAKYKEAIDSPWTDGGAFTQWEIDNANKW
jgi:hypothetical protein